jgi:hypothetical protein
MTGKAIKPATIMKLGITASVPATLDCRIGASFSKSESEGRGLFAPSLQI